MNTFQSKDFKTQKLTMFKHIFYGCETIVVHFKLQKWRKGLTQVVVPHYLKELSVKYNYVRHTKYIWYVFTQSRIYRPFYAQGVREEKWLQTVSVLNTSPLKKSNFDINVQILGEDQIKREPITFS